FVDVSPSIAREGVRAIRDFVAANVEFDRIEDFVERVQGYDPFRTREHIERTARYNLFHRVDGKLVSKADRSRQRPAGETGGMSLDDVRAIPCPALVVRGESSRVLEPAAA